MEVYYRQLYIEEGWQMFHPQIIAPMGFPMGLIKPNKISLNSWLGHHHLYIQLTL